MTVTISGTGRQRPTARASLPTVPASVPELPTARPDGAAHRLYLNENPPPLGAASQAVADAFAAECLMVRAFPVEGVRISIGMPEANEAVLAFVRSGAPWPRTDEPNRPTD
jgi:hypothetical protein